MTKWLNWLNWIMSPARNMIDSQKQLSQSLKFQVLSSEVSLVLGSQRPESNHEGLLVVVSCWVVSSSLPPHELQHSRLPCPSLSPGVSSDSCPVCQWCDLTISSSAPHFSFCLQPFPTSGSFLTSWLFASGGQSIGDSASTSAPPMNIWVNFL